MIDRHFALRFADEWIAAWNSHDLDGVLAHYDEEFEMTTPFIARVMGEPSGRLRGKAAVGAYWRAALERMPELHFTLIEVLHGVDTVQIYYTSVRGLRAIETLWFSTDGRVVRAMANYNG